MIEFLEMPSKTVLVSKQEVIDKRFDLAWPKASSEIKAFAEAHGLETKEWLAVSPDPPTKVPCYYFPGIFLTGKIPKKEDLTGTLELKTFECTRFGVFTLKGSYSLLYKAWPEGMSEFQETGHKMVDRPFEYYVDPTGSVPEEDQRTYIVFPSD
ncbi:hypothetical protein EDD86DRAFT_207546 [Gorgonomyces haynaldii]|nr:hypothetical protein EDD86DRAFT_207546 [Gorgonomyces haynaldii]